MSRPSPGAPPEQPSGAVRSEGGRADVVLDLAGGLALAAVVEAATWWSIGAPATHLVLAGGIYTTLCALLLRSAPPGMPGGGIGPANRVTLGRAAVTVPVFASAPWPGGVDARGAWVMIVLGTVALILDGVDGRVARRTGTSRFGARFDMELDAALIMALSLLVWTSGRAGAWVLLIGLMRYLFVAAGRVWPALRVELPARIRRSAVCVVQGVALLVALGPIVPLPMASAVLTIALAALGWSFAVDVAWALRQGSPRS